MTTVPVHQPDIDDDLAWDVAKLFPRQGQWTAEEYLAVAMDTNRLVELVDGRLEVQARPSLTHQRVLQYVLSALHGFVATHNLGEVLMAAYAVRLCDRTFREPDVLFVSEAHRAEMQERYTSYTDLVIEVVSESSRENDYQIKRGEYAASRIPEYWLIDPQARIVIVHRLEDDTYTELGRYRPGDRAASVVLAGFELDVTAVFAAGEGKID
jgi:Uma2 family endonuclease